MKNFLNEITGPVIPLPVPFDAQLEVDHTALHNYVQYLTEHGIKNIMTTVGTSRFNLLTGEEVMAVNETVVKAAAGKAVTIVANPSAGSLKHAIEFGKHAKRVGADFYLVYFPERHYGDDNTFSFFKEIDAQVDMPLLIHEMPMRNGVGPGSVQYSLELLKRLLDLPRVAGMKEEALDPEYSNRIVEAFSNQAILIGAGGGMSRYLNRDYSRGSLTFLGGLGNMTPAIELDFYQAITSNNQAEAARIVNEIEAPYFNQVLPIGWHPSLKGALAAARLLPEYERPPMKQLSASEKEIISNAVKPVLNYAVSAAN